MDHIKAPPGRSLLPGCNFFGKVGPSPYNNSEPEAAAEKGAQVRGEQTADDRDGCGVIPGCAGDEKEEEMPEVEIDIDDLLDAASEEERVVKLQESLVDCYKPTEEFINQLLSRIQGMRKLSPPQKKDV
ncbi:protein phosphatase 1 regulatory subunit 14C isoform X3 [Engystomops pustulosus]|uniref:protein phosphatase 1 regulatory subunit 14C isoform X3 n=1 Tax=Engystomops pustulosus TaxID=76066 RepID=UPI003AFA9926